VQVLTPVSEGGGPFQIPDKLYFRIGEVSRLVGVPPYVLRYWETEFPHLAPRKSPSGQRFYRRKDVETILEIKRLLYEKRFTIEGARKYMESQHNTTRSRAATQGQLFAGADLSFIKGELEAILELLRR
jgi:DNA-binding transcriptional MerR regulator